MVTRKGSLKPIDVPIDVLDRLNFGTIETVNLAECLAVDFAILMAQVVPELATVAKSRIQPSDGITKRMATAGKLLFEIWRLILPILSVVGQLIYWRRFPIDPWSND
jgi:hypothetical protein